MRSSNSFKKKVPKEANNNTIKILIKLFAIKMVANNFLGFSKRPEMTSNCVEFVLESFSRSAFDREKNATSVPEINAEDINKKNNPIV